MLLAACLCRFALGDQEPVKNSTPRPPRCELFFFFYPALDPWALLRWTARETVKDLPRSVTRRPPEFSVILSRAAWGFQVQRPGQQVVVPVVPVPVVPPPDVEPGEQRKQLGFGTPKLPKSTHACPRQEPAPGFPTRPRQRQHGVGSAGKSRRLNSQASQHRMS